MTVGMRPADSSDLLEPYIEDLALLLDDDQGIRNGAIYIPRRNEAGSIAQSPRAFGSSSE
jgi:hypothetical protein